MSIKNFQLALGKLLVPVIQRNNHIFNEIYKYIKDINAEKICDVFDKDYILIDDLNICLSEVKSKTKVITIDIFEENVSVLFFHSDDILLKEICFCGNKEVTSYINKLKQKIKKWNS